MENKASNLHPCHAVTHCDFPSSACGPSEYGDDRGEPSQGNLVFVAVIASKLHQCVELVQAVSHLCMQHLREVLEQRQGHERGNPNFLVVFGKLLFL